MLQRLLIVTCLAALLGGSAGALLSAMQAAPVQSAQSLRRDEIIALLREGAFDRLDSLMGALNDDVGAKRRPERDLTQAFNAFATSDPEVTQRLEAWVQAQPQSAMALMAHGVHRFHLVRLVRYHLPLTDAGMKLLQRLQGDERQAFIDVQKSLGRHEMNAIGFVWTLEAFADWGQPEEVERWYRVAVNDLPKSAAIHRAYLSSFAPWRQGTASWEQSMVQLKKAAATLRAGFAGDADFAWLPGFVEYIQAEAYRRAGRAEEALAHFDAAIKAAADPKYLIGRGQANVDAGKADAALVDFEKAIEAEPDDGEAIDGRGNAKLVLSRREEALADFDLAVRLDPLNAKYLVDRARTLHQLGRDADARRDVDNALIYGSNDPWVQVWRAALYEAFDRGVAGKAFNLALQLAPEDPAYVKRYGEFLARAQDCAGIAVIAQYRAMCESSAGCSGYDPEKVAALEQQLRQTAHCAK